MFTSRFSKSEGTPVGTIYAKIDGRKSKKCGRTFKHMFGSSGLIRTNAFDGQNPNVNGWIGTTSYQRSSSNGRSNCRRGDYQNYPDPPHTLSYVVGFPRSLMHLGLRMLIVAFLREWSTTVYTHYLSSSLFL